MDVYDEVDRRENETSQSISYGREYFFLAYFVSFQA